jgi:hypothetical protein
VNACMTAVSGSGQSRLEGLSAARSGPGHVQGRAGSKRPVPHAALHTPEALRASWTAPPKRLQRGPRLGLLLTGTKPSTHGAAAAGAVVVRAETAGATLR